MALLLLALCVCWDMFSVLGSTKPLLVSKPVVTSVEVFEVDELSPVNINHSVPTGPLVQSHWHELNLPMWAKHVTESSIVSVETVMVNGRTRQTNITAAIQALLQHRVDPDLTVHVCLGFNGSEAHDAISICPITLGSKEDKNRFLDLRLQFTCGLVGRKGAGVVRLVIAEDAGKAVQIPHPLSFDVVIDRLRLEGKDIGGDYVGRHQCVSQAGERLDAEHLVWVNSSWVQVVVAKTEQWPWKCSPRKPVKIASSSTQLSKLEHVLYNFLDTQGSFEEAVRAAVQRLEQRIPGEWSVSFGASINNSSRHAVAYSVFYTLCGHLMTIPITVQSLPVAAS